MDKFIPANHESMMYNESTPAYTGRFKSNDMTRISNELFMLFSNCLLFINGWVTLDENKKATIIYINGTKGKHLAKIIKLFPFITFHIYDELNLCDELIISINETDNTEFFPYIPSNEELSDKYAKFDENIYLISEYTDKEIRNEPDYSGLKDEDILESKKKYHEKKEDLIVIDSDKNIEIAKAVNAKFSFLKFRPPHVYEHRKAKDFVFYNGNVVMPIFSDKKTVNCRMVVNNYTDLVKWDYNKFAGVLNTWHYDTKEKLGLNPITGGVNPLPNQLGNHFEICVLFSLIRDYYFTIGHSFAKDIDILNFYIDFLIDGRCDNDDVCNNN